MKYFVVSLLGVLFLSSTVTAQESHETVVANTGDGIFSILRAQGIDASKYYEEFVELNKDNLIEGSELHAGKEYLLPDAPDSFKNMGRFIQVPEVAERTIFENRLSELTLKSEELKNAVYYLIPEEKENSSKKASDNLTNDIMLNLAKALLENGARVYILASTKEDIVDDEMKLAQAYVSEINKRYIRHSGKYQRLLMVKSNGTASKRNIDVLVSYHLKSQEGQKFAQNLQSAFKSSNGKKSSEDVKVFDEKEELFLAKNTLPALTVIEIGETNDAGNQKISLPKNKDALTKYLTKGIFDDYADLKFED